MAETPRNVVVNIQPAVAPDSKVSAKVWASTLATLALSLVLAIVTALVNDPATLQQVLDAVPSWARFIIMAALPTLVTFLAGYAKRDRTRELGQAVQDTLSGKANVEPAVAPEPEGSPHMDEDGYAAPETGEHYAE
jgi:hypothetical protein